MRLQNWNPPVGTLGGTGFTYRSLIDPQPWWDQTSSAKQMVMTMFSWWMLVIQQQCPFQIIRNPMKLWGFDWIPGFTFNVFNGTCNIKPQEIVLVIVEGRPITESSLCFAHVFGTNFYSEVLDVSAAKWLMPSKRGVEKRNKARDNKKRRSKEPVMAFQPPLSWPMASMYDTYIYLHLPDKLTKCRLNMPYMDGFVWCSAYSGSLASLPLNYSIPKPQVCVIRSSEFSF